jgi:outer membrane immunogenic protein
VKKLIAGMPALLGMIASPSFGADFPPSPPPAYGPAAVPAAYGWSGCSFGGNLGGGWTNSHFVHLGVDDGRANGAGVVGGGQVGCDYQIGALVFGLQGMFDGTSIKSNGVEPNGVIKMSSTLPWLATLTGRIGFAVEPTTLIYAKGGGAWVSDSTTFTLPGGPIASSSYTASGWTAGGGLEHAFMPHWSVFVEYDYMDFGTKTATFNYVWGGSTPINVSQNVQMAIVGVNFRF